MARPLVQSFPPPTGEVYRTAERIVLRLREAGFESYLVGGCVRDLVTGHPPKDYDITTAARPEEVMALFGHSIPLGASFGVVTVVEDGTNFEVATFREERDYMDGRRPETLRYSRTPAEDVSRRDFTINALLYDPEKRCIVDYTGGLADLRRGVLRTIGDARTRFSEDYLRMLRAVRFTARFRFRMDTETFDAIRELAPKLTLLSAERVRNELTAMLCGPEPDQAFRLLSGCGILAVVLPEIEAMHGVEQPAQFHPEGDVFEHTMLLLKHLAWPGTEIGWAALLHDVGKPSCRTVGKDGVAHFYGHEEAGAGMAEAILHRLKMPSAVIEHVTAAVRNHMRFAAVQKMRPAKWRRLIADPNFPLELELHRLDCISCHGLLENYLWLLDRMDELRKTGVEALPPPLLTGHDLIALGVEPGPDMGRLLTALRDLQLEGGIGTRSDALQALEKLRRS
ncbi:MAG: CCA tRNA nucleotidyltransferase [Lentisphaeria bacterium]|nr:CCA tRNA nucleotidyltransferase [Lentisphaeria bacterium]